MNFFDDDFGLGESPSARGTSKITKKPSNISSKSVKNENFDDLLEEMLLKQDKKKSKKKISEAPSVIDKRQVSPPRQNLTRTDKFDSLSKVDIRESGQTYEPIRNRQSTKSIFDDKGSEDNKSYQSGFTGKGSHMDNLNTMKFNEKSQVNFPQSSMRRPPLRKRGQSKETSFANQELGGSISKMPDHGFHEIESVSIFPPPRPQKQKQPFTFKKQQPNISFTNDKRLQLSESVPQKQKIVYVKEQNKLAKEQHEKQIKMIKQSHQRQIKYLEQQLKKQTEDSKNLKDKMMRQLTQQNERNQRRLQQMSKKDLERVKDMHEWEMKKKTQSYEMEINRLNKLLEMNSNLNKNISELNKNNRNQFLVQEKEKQIQHEKRKLYDLQSHLKERERALQIREMDFDNYRKREEEKVQQQRRNNYNYENEIRKQQNEAKRSIASEKIEIANDLAHAELQIQKQKEEIRLQKSEIEMEKQLFEKMKEDYEYFNKNVVNEYKQKLKEVEIEKMQLQQRQIELYKKIHTVELMGTHKTVAYSPEKIKDRGVENERNINNNQFNKIKQTKERFEKMEQSARKRSNTYIDKNSDNVKSYLSKVNKAKGSMWKGNY